MNKPWRHHFIPQLLLRGFTDGNGSMYYFDREEPHKSIQYNTPKALFFEKHLYSTIDYETGDLDVSLELFFAKIEDRAARIIDKIVTAARAGKPHPA